MAWFMAMRHMARGMVAMMGMVIVIAIRSAYMMAGVMIVSVIIRRHESLFVQPAGDVGDPRFAVEQAAIEDGTGIDLPIGHGHQAGTGI
jgi:hypothetical protein